MTILRPRCDFVERNSTRRKPSDAAAQFLPAPNGRIDVKRVELETVAVPSHALRCDQGRAASQKWIKHDCAAPRAIHDRVRDHRHGLWRGMQSQQVTLAFTAPEVVGAAVLPDIRAVPAKSPQLHIINVWLASVLEHQHELVLAAVKRAHTAIVLDPDA